MNKLVPDNLKLKKYRVVLLIGAVLFSGLSVSLKFMYPEVWNPTIIRFIIVGLGLILFILSFILNKKPQILSLIAELLVLGVMLYSLFLIFMTDVHPGFVLSFVMLYLIMGILLRNRLLFTIYNLIVVAVIPFVVLVSEPQFSILLTIIIIEISAVMLFHFNLNRERILDDLNEKNRMLEQAGANIEEVFWLMDNQKVVYVTPNFEKVWEIPEDEFRKNPDVLFNTIHPDDKERILMAYRNPLYIENGMFNEQYRILGKQGQTRWMQVQSYPLMGEHPDCHRIVGIAKDITRMKEMEKELQLLSETDDLTGIYNPVRFRRILENELTRAQRYKNNLSMIMFDIDEFDEYKDNFGYSAADQIMKMIVDIVHSLIRDNDFLARWAGNVFVILLPETDLKGAEILAGRLGQKFLNGSKNYITEITCCFGVTAFYANDDYEQFTKRVEKALLEAQKQGHNTVVVKE